MMWTTGDDVIWKDLPNVHALVGRQETSPANCPEAAEASKQASKHGNSINIASHEIKTIRSLCPLASALSASALAVPANVNVVSSLVPQTNAGGRLVLTCHLV